MGEARRPPAHDSFFGRAFQLAGEDLKQLDNGVLSVVCPWSSEHTTPITGADDTSAAILPPTTETKWGLFKCLHAHCAHRTTLDLLDVLPSAALVAARHEHGAGLIRARVWRGHVEHLPAQPGFAALDRLFLWLVPVGGGQGFAWTVKLGSAAHIALDSLGIDELRGRRVDVAFRGREITWGRLVPSSQEKRRTGT